MYCVSYGPRLIRDSARIDVWPHALELGKPMPTVPLALGEDLFVPVDLEATCVEACRRIRLPT